MALSVRGSTLKTLWKLNGFLKTFPACSIAVRLFGQPAPQTHPHLLNTGEVTPGISKEEFEFRRNKLANIISAHDAASTRGDESKNHLVIIPGAPVTYMSTDVPYVFRQNTDLLYLTGFQEPNSVLVLEVGRENKKPVYTSFLFVPKKDEKRELWEGLRSGVENAPKLTGIENCQNIDDLEKYLESYLRRNRIFTLWCDYARPVNRELHDGVISKFIQQQRHLNIYNPIRRVQGIRIKKSEAEIRLVKQSTKIGAQALTEVMKYSYPGVNEAHLYAKMDFECRVRGAEMLAYPPVVAGGNRANTIHYISNNQLVHDSELVLMDAGCECHGYVSDVTRTWPVSGKFTEAQREVYEAVLRVQKQCIQCCVAKSSLDSIFQYMLKQIGLECQKLGILPRHLYGAELSNQARMICPHHIGHYLGMDVHDTSLMSCSLDLEPGMVVTIEPGIYLPENNLSIPEKYRGMGVRIEDDVLITSHGPEVLTSLCPKEPDDIEALLKSR
ncbi:probable Xaa-Pro aminopeptidase 3 [Lingula anatina]|uniref:Probable Xaa-Pro aminopeptidase 3 n=1 Tax=Lingula anatina TaxID=7574 RepID=A0A1S3JSC2_LINAN|nr:probable Xaa-Pro aminopeptidase 3 [Lingula anatina]|eukprot:XP_013413280.1 probable Xaa-Pro aminopeptidase 3 [Lingula anatina]